MVGSRSASRRSGPPCWAKFGALSVGAFFFLFLASPISAQDPEAYSGDVEGENVTTPSTPIRQFVWRVRNWMFHRDDEDVNIEVNTSEATAEPTEEEKQDGDCDESRSWARSVAAWFARGIRNLLEQLYPQENGTADGNTNGTEGVPTQDGTIGGKPRDKPAKGNDAEDTATKPNTHIFRPWTALPPPPPPGMTASPDTGSSSSDESTSSYTKHSPGKGSGDSAGKTSTAGSKSTSETPTGASSPKKPKRRRPKPISTTSTITPEIPPMPPISTEEVFIQDTGNEI